MNKKGNMILGIVLIIIGVIFGLNSLEITNINIFFDGWWTLFIIIPCAMNIVKEQGKFANYIGLIIGIVFLLASQDIIGIDLIFKLAIPFTMVAIGIYFIIKETDFDKKEK